MVSFWWLTAGVGCGRVELGSWAHMEVLVDAAEHVAEALLTMHSQGYAHLDIKVGPARLHSAEPC